MTQQPRTPTRWDIYDLAAAIVGHLWRHPKHDPTCEACLAIKSGRLR